MVNGGAFSITSNLHFTFNLYLNVKDTPFKTFIMQVQKNIVFAQFKFCGGQTMQSSRSLTQSSLRFSMTKGDKKLHEQMNKPIFDFSKINLDRKRIYVFGATFHGALGLQDLLRPKDTRKAPMKFIHHPVRHKFVYYLDVKDIAAGHGFTLFGVNRKDPNRPLIFGCGLNNMSQLGYQAVRSNAPLEQLIAPVGVSVPVQGERPEILALAAGRGHSIVSVKKEGLITWGSNSAGQCGRRIVSDETYFGSKFAHRIPKFRFNPLGNNDEVIAIAARFDLSVCLTQSGKVYTFGDNHKGQLGRGKGVLKTWDASTPVLGDLAEEKVVKIATNGNSVLAVTDKGDLFGWGCNETGILIPQKISTIFYEPVKIQLSSNIGKAKDVAIGDLTTNVINERGNVYTWGQGPTLGLGPSNTYVREPTLMPPPLFGRSEYNPDAQVTSVAAGIFSSAAINSQGDLFTWGSNNSGNLGLGDMKQQYFPLKVCLNGAALKVCIGVDHTIVLTKGGF